MGVPITDDRFWQVWDSEAQPWLMAAFRRHRKEEAEWKNEMIRTQFWIGNMTSHFGTLVTSYLTNKQQRPLGDLYAYPEWKEAMRKAEQKPKDPMKDSQSIQRMQMWHFGKNR